MICIILSLVVVFCYGKILKRIPEPSNIGETVVSEILDQELYLSSLGSVQEESYLRKNQIGVVISMMEAQELDWIKHFEKIEYFAFPQKTGKSISDSELSHLFEYFERSFQLIEIARENRKRILVHCISGKTRSPSIVISYIMKKFSWDFEKSLNFVKDKRSEVDPNPRFIEMLKQYEIILTEFKKTEDMEQQISKSKEQVEKREDENDVEQIVGSYSFLIILVILSVLVVLGVCSALIAVKGVFGKGDGGKQV